MEQRNNYSDSELSNEKVNTLEPIELKKSNTGYPITPVQNHLYAYLQQVKQYPYLTPEEEKECIIQWTQHKDLKAANKLVMSHLRLSVKLAMKYKGYGLPIFDVIEEGNTGLMVAVKRFNSKYNVRFATYASWWVKAYINEYILSMWSVVTISRSMAQKKLFFNLRRLKKQLNIDQNADLLTSKHAVNIADQLNVKYEDVAAMDNLLTKQNYSLDAPVSQTETDMIHYLPSPNADSETSLITQSEKQWQRKLLVESLSKLKDREKSILIKRKLQEPPNSLLELSKEYGISIERVRQIEGVAFGKMQMYIQKEAKKRGYISAS